MKQFLNKKNLDYTIYALAGLASVYMLSQTLSSVSHQMKGHSETSMKEEIGDPWREKLTETQYFILRQKGTEVPYTSDLVHEKRAGTYYAVDTKEPVFRSEDKFDSGTGWPSFSKPIKPEAVMEATDSQYGMTRTEVLTTAGGHLGHVFTDGPEPTGLRYCMNGGALYFVPDDAQESN